MRLVLALLLVIATSKMNLLFVEEIVRHGARAPEVLFDWAANPEENFDAGARLTPMGMRQHYLIGQEIRRRYLQEYNLTGSLEYNFDDFKFYSTETHRTIESMQSQLAGLFPPETCS